MPADERRNDDAAFRTGAWTGDVWKILPALKKHRPDLVAVPRLPADGLVAITNLDPASTVLADSYFQIVDEFVDLDTPTGLADIFATIELTYSRELAARPSDQAFLAVGPTCLRTYKKSFASPQGMPKSFRPTVK